MIHQTRFSQRVQLVLCELNWYSCRSPSSCTTADCIARGEGQGPATATRRQQSGWRAGLQAPTAACYFLRCRAPEAARRIGGGAAAAAAAGAPPRRAASARASSALPFFTFSSCCSFVYSSRSSGSTCWGGRRPPCHGSAHEPGDCWLRPFILHLPLRKPNQRATIQTHNAQTLIISE